MYPEYETITPVIGSDGIITNFVAVKEDISERRAMQEENNDLQISYIRIRRLSPWGVRRRHIHDFNNTCWFPLSDMPRWE